MAKLKYREPYPLQVFDPEDMGPPPPGYGERGGNYLLLDENVQNPNYLPVNSSGETNSAGPEYGPEPPTFHATNVPDTARKWGAQGQDYTFLAESPGAMKTAEELGAPNVMKGYQDPEPSAIGPEPKPGELDEMGQFKTFWGHYVNEKYKGRDPLELNPSEEGLKAEETARSKYALELMNREPGSVDYKQYEKLIADAKKDAEKKTEWERKIGEEDKKMAQGFFKEKLSADRKAAAANQPKAQTRANVEEAQKYTERALYGSNSWQNYDLTPEDLKALAADKNYIPKDRKVKARILTDVNRVRGLAGLPPITEKPVSVPVSMVETTNFTPWGPRIPGTKKTNSVENRAGYQYEEGQAPAPIAAAPGPGAVPASLPDPKANKGRSGVESTTGKRYRSDGNTWVEIK